MMRTVIYGEGDNAKPVVIAEDTPRVRSRRVRYLQMCIASKYPALKNYSPFRALIDLAAEGGAKGDDLLDECYTIVDNFARVLSRCYGENLPLSPSYKQDLTDAEVWAAWEDYLDNNDLWNWLYDEAGRSTQIATPPEFKPPELLTKEQLNDPN